MKDACLVFDCMETLVDMTEIPEPSDYAFWAYEGSGVEALWDDFDEFWKAYAALKESHIDQHGPWVEQDLMARLNSMVEGVLKLNRHVPEHLLGLSTDQVASQLFENFWTHYLSRCYVRPDVLAVLNQFKRQNYVMGVVSNFTVRGGVEEILEKCGIHDYFQFVHTSIHNAYRKPHPNLFYEVLRSCGCSADNILYLGDDYECDYMGAGGFGFKTYLLDRQNRYPQVENRVFSFEEFAGIVEKLRTK